MGCYSDRIYGIFLSDKAIPWQNGILQNEEGAAFLPANIELLREKTSILQAMSRE